MDSIVRTEFYIYGLASSKDSIIRYVGQTNKPAKRLKDHKSIARTENYNHKNNWIRSVISDGEELEMILLDKLRSREEANAAERLHIARMIECGFDLTNSTTGGDGAYLHTERSRINMSRAKLGKKASLETKKRMSEAHKKRYEDPAERERSRQMSLARNATPPNFHGEGVTGAKLTDQKVAEIRSRMNSGESFKQVSEYHEGISRTTVWNAAIGKTWSHVGTEVYKPKRRRSPQAT